jgi:hypothetical protein
VSFVLPGYTWLHRRHSGGKSDENGPVNSVSKSGPVRSAIGIGLQGKEGKGILKKSRAKTKVYKSNSALIDLTSHTTSTKD